jgi:diguanylate cyclase (GGDEF)-like protein
VLVVGVIALQEAPAPERHGRVRRLLGKVDDIALEIATLSLGALTAVAVVLNGWLILLVLVPLVVLHRADMARQLEQRAATDGKTGLLNAAAWHDKAERALRRAQRQGAAAGLLILDLDHFKSVNDNYGHEAGDEVLREFADRLRSCVRGVDLACRLGGEEFVVVMPDTDAGIAARVAERVRRRIAGEPFSVDRGTRSIEVTISIGLASLTGVEDTPALILKRADEALYRAKKSGRNRVVSDAA